MAVKIEVFNAEQDNVIKLGLKQQGARVILVAYNQDGREYESGILLVITADGIIRPFGVGDAIPFPKDGQGRIKIVE